MVYTREQRSLFSLKIQELILYYIASIFSLFYLKIQSMILFYTKESSLPLFSLKTNALIRYYIQDSILPLFSFNVKYGLPRPPSPPSDIETQQSVCQKRKPGAPDSSSFPCQSNNSPIERDGEFRMGAGSVC